MNSTARSAGWAFSLGAHALLLGGLLFFARDAVYVEPRSCRVSLAPGTPMACQPNIRQVPPNGQTATPQERKQAKEPVVKHPAPAVARTEPKKISPHKRDTANMARPPDHAQQPVPKVSPVPPPSTPASGGKAEAVGSSGPQPHQSGGLSAYEYSALDQRPSIIRRAEPEYPAKARRMSVQGAVVVQLVVDAAGQPRNCTVVRATPDGFFEEAALAAARQMRFAPGKIKGQAVNTIVQLPFSFKLQ